MDVKETVHWEHIHVGKSTISLSGKGVQLYYKFSAEMETTSKIIANSPAIKQTLVNSTII
jgi:hypothetical protein